MAALCPGAGGPCPGWANAMEDATIMLVIAANAARSPGLRASQDGAPDATAKVCPNNSWSFFLAG